VIRPQNTQWEGDDDTCDILEEAVNLAFDGKPGPVHIHVPQSLTDRGVRMSNYRDIELNVRPVQPDPAQVDAIAVVVADALN
jgi:acetolactate synthase I/II/III large subunit